jgi:uncharacterized protein (DUF2236 family)
MKLPTPGVDEKRARFYEEQAQLYSFMGIYFRVSAEQQEELLQYINKLASSCKSG